MGDEAASVKTLLGPVFLMEYTFVVDHAGGNTQRKRTLRACEECKAKKKRCTHSGGQQIIASRDAEHADAPRARGKGPTPVDNTPASPVTVESDNPSDGRTHTPQRERLPRQSGHSRSPDERLSSRGSPSRSQRFVGDLNPETVFYSESNATGSSGLNNRLNDIGVWVPGSKDVQQNREGETSGSSFRHSTHPPELHVKDRKRKRTRLLGEGLSLLPGDQSALIDIYFANIHPLLPILDEGSFRQAVSEKTASSILVKAVCLAASKDSSAATHLHFQDESRTLPTREFGRRLYAELSSCHVEDEETNKVTAIRCLALLSLHSERPDGSEHSSWNLMRAIHLAQTIGLHLGRGREKRQYASFSSLFWTIWSLDRINAAINGRPVMLHGRDIGLKFESSYELFDAPFRIWLRLAQVLDSIIGLYRPAATESTSIPGIDISGFEDLVDQCNGWGIGHDMLVSLEIFHHATCILSCRLRAVNKHPSSSASYLRQCNSANQIVSIVQLQSHMRLSPLPVIPYAISLSLAVAYKQLRQSKLETTRELAKKQILACSQTLEKLSDTWWSAGTMAKLAKRALRQLEKHTQRFSIQGNQGQNNPPLPSPVPSLVQNRTISVNENASLAGQTDMVTDGRRPSETVDQFDGFHLPETTTTNAGCTDNLQNANAANLFDPSLNANVPPGTYFWPESAGINDIDVFLGDFLDMRSSSRIAEDAQFFDLLGDTDEDTGDGQAQHQIHAGVS